MEVAMVTYKEICRRWKASQVATCALLGVMTLDVLSAVLSLAQLQARGGMIVFSAR